MSAVALAIVTLSRTGFSNETLIIFLFIFGLSAIFAIPKAFKIIMGLDNDDNQK